MGRIRLRAAPLEGLPPARRALVAAIRKVVQGSRFDSLDQLGAAMYRRPAGSERRDGKRISEWARGAEFPQGDDLLRLIQVCDRQVWGQVEPLFRAAALERLQQPHVSASPPSVLVTTTTFWEAAREREPGADAPVVGRAGAQERLLELVAAAQAPSGPRVVVVEGPGGIGKTRLAVEAAESSGSTLITRIAVPLPWAAVAEVPRDRPVVLVVDDAHRCPDLGGVAALLGDPEFAAVSVIVTVRPGRTRDVLRRLGLDEAPTVGLAPLIRANIDQIIQDRGFHDRGFRLHVVLVASGNPLLAHTACTLAAERDSYSWATTAELLRDLVRHRLNHLDDPVDQHRAAAVALAVLSSAVDSDQVSALAGAITMLPSATDLLDVLLEDLVDAGLADAQPYRIRPDAVAPVLAADALTARARVRLKPGRLLQTLGRAAAFRNPSASPSDDEGVFGLGVPAQRDLSGLGVDVNRLASQLSTLAQAAFLAEDAALVALLDNGVLELLAPDADVSEWVDVLTLAGQIVPTSPALLNSLRSALVRQWPPAPSSWPFGVRDEVLAHRQDLERFLQSAMTVAERAGRRDPASATRWVLECGWLSYPAVDGPALTTTRRAVSSLTGTDPQGAAETWDDVFRRRETVLATLRSWGTERTHRRPTLLRPAEHQVRSSAVADRVVLAGLRPLLGMITDVRVMATPGDGDVMTIGQDLLPDDPRTRATLSAAVDVVEEILDRIDPAYTDAVEALRTIAQLPFELRAEVVRGRWGSEDPLPDYAAQALERAAARITAALAARWTGLPLMARHAAAIAAAQRVGSRSARLVDLAEAGDPVAAAAVTDTELARLQTLLPIEPNRHQRHSDEAAADAGEAERRQAAEHLGARTSLADALALLDTIDVLPPGSFENYLVPFARQVGQHLTDLDQLLGRLNTARVLSDVHVLGAAARNHPEPVIEWLNNNLSTLHIAELAMLVADDLPHDQEDDLLTRVTHELTTHPAAAASGTPPDGPEPSDRHSHRSLVLAHQLISHLTWCHRPARDRLERLHVLGIAGPPAMVNNVISVIGCVLSASSQTLADGVEGHTGVREGLIDVLGRALALSDTDPFLDDHHDTADGARYVVQTAPQEAAALFLRRAIEGVAQPVPSAWLEHLALLPATTRRCLANAVTELLQAHRDAGDLTAEAETAVIALHTQLDDL